MTDGPVSQVRWSQLSAFIADKMGLHFPRERWNDLQRGLTSAAAEFGFADAAECVDWLLAAPSTQAQLQVLASHLTIGETYFLRDKPTLEALTGHILPELIRARRGRDQRLRIWSAACCTGEEPYSLAILLHEALPDLRDWQVTITATDINPRFLHKAAAGVYGEWSFRNAPPWLKQRYFTPTADGRYAIAPRIKKLVNFAHLNLAQDVYPSLATDTNAMDVIFCRNVLMYFTPPQVRTVIGHLHLALIEGGWLAVSPSEASAALFWQFNAVTLSDAIVFHKGATPPLPHLSTTQSTHTPPVAVHPIETSLPQVPSAAAAVDVPSVFPAQHQAAPQAPDSALAAARSLYQQGRFSEVVDTLTAAPFALGGGPAAFSLLARALGNRGQLAQALTWCDRWIAADKLDPAGHYLRAVVLLERGDHEQARTSLRRANYLDPDFVLAHFSLGNLAHRRGDNGEAGKHFANAKRLLQRYQPDDLLPESDGLTAGRLARTLSAITDLEPVP